MGWTNLPTDYTDATFTGLRKYAQVNNEDGTVSFMDMTSYSNREKSFFGAKDANAMNGAINNIMGTVQITPTLTMDQIELIAGEWVDHGDYQTQVVALAEVKPNERIDIQPDSTALLQLMNDGVSAMYVENEDSILTVYSIGGVPSVSLTVQVSRVGVPVSD